MSRFYSRTGFKPVTDFNSEDTESEQRKTTSNDYALCASLCSLC